MNNNLPPDKVKYNDILPFPTSSVREQPSFEEIKFLKERIVELENTIVSLSTILAGRESRPEIKTPVEVPSAPESRPLPEEDKTVTRIALCSELMRFLLGHLEIAFGTPKFAPGEKANRPRVHFVEDNSFIYFNEWGHIHAGQPNKTSKGVIARRQLRQLFAMREAIAEESPILAAALLKSQFNATVEEK
jgi:hypothetical protein